MHRLPLVLALLAACGRVGFYASSDAAAGDGAGDAVNLPAGATLDLDFTATLPPSFEFTRSTGATYLDAAGVMQVAGIDEPRFDHDPTTLEPLGLLVEEAVKNYAHRTDQLDDGIDWFSNGNVGIGVDLAVAPDGTMSADAVIDQDTSVLARRAQLLFATNDSQSYTFSIFLKADTSTLTSFGGELLNGTTPLQSRMDIDLATGAITTPPPGATGYGLVAYPNSWYRVWITLTNNGTGNDQGVLSVWGDPSSLARTGSVFAWGAQFELSRSPSSYIPSPLANEPLRASDRALATTVPWLDQLAGTFFVSARLGGARTDIQPAVCLLADPSRKACVARDGASGRAMIEFDNTPQILGQAWPAFSDRTVIISYDPSGIAIHDPTTVTTAASFFGPVVTGAGYGCDGDLGFGGHIRRITYWPRVLDGAELATLGVQ